MAKADDKNMPRNDVLPLGCVQDGSYVSLLQKWENRNVTGSGDSSLGTELQGEPVLALELCIAVSQKHEHFHR